jgi:hypothetical protein
MASISNLVQATPISTRDIYRLFFVRMKLKISLANNQSPLQQFFGNLFYK